MLNGQAVKSKAMKRSLSKLYDTLKERLSPSQLILLGFLLLISIGTILLLLPISTASGERMSFINALFTATSAVCVTGLIVVDTSTYFSPFGKTVLIILIQFGGLGIMTLTTLFAVLLGRRITLRGRIIAQETLGYISRSDIIKLVISIIITTAILETIGAVVLFLRFLISYNFPLMKALVFGIFHSVSAFCNAGFSLFTTNFENFSSDSIINFSIIFLLFLGGLGFGALMDIYNLRSFRKYALQSKMVIAISLGLIVVGTSLILLMEYSNPATLGPKSFGDKLLSSLFQSMTPRTAGFNTVRINALNQASMFIIIMLMFVGASPGSTGGGIKTTTFGTLFFASLSAIRGKKDVEIFERRLPASNIWRALAVTSIALTVISFVTILLLISEKKPLIDIMFETVSAFGTVGLSTGLTPNLTSIGKFFLVVTMFIGRVGPFTFALALSLREKRTLFRYPIERVTIG